MAVRAETAAQQAGGEKAAAGYHARHMPACGRPNPGQFEVT